jgi:hypothetical protein
VVHAEHDARGDARHLDLLHRAVRCTTIGAGCPATAMRIITSTDRAAQHGAPQAQVTSAALLPLR